MDAQGKVAPISRRTPLRAPSLEPPLAVSALAAVFLAITAVAIQILPFPFPLSEILLPEPPLRGDEDPSPQPEPDAMIVSGVVQPIKLLPHLQIPEARPLGMLFGCFPVRRCSSGSQPELQMPLKEDHRAAHPAVPLMSSAQRPGAFFLSLGPAPPTLEGCLFFPFHVG